MMLSREFISAMQWMQKLMPIAFEFYAIAGRDQDVRHFLKEYYIAFEPLTWARMKPPFQSADPRSLAGVTLLMG